MENISIKGIKLGYKSKAIAYYISDYNCYYILCNYNIYNNKYTFSFSQMYDSKKITDIKISKRLAKEIIKELNNKYIINKIMHKNHIIVNIKKFILALKIKTL